MNDANNAAAATPRRFFRGDRQIRSRCIHHYRAGDAAIEQLECQRAYAGADVK